MLRNLIKTASGHAVKHPGYSLLNILGLTLGYYKCTVSDYLCL